MNLREWEGVYGKGKGGNNMVILQFQKTKNIIKMPLGLEQMKQCYLMNMGTGINICVHTALPFTSLAVHQVSLSYHWL